MNGFLVAFAISFGIVFVAELGDKSQLMVLTFATRYRALPVLIGITLAAAVVHGISVAIGYGLGAALPTGWIALVGALAFLGFGAWTLRPDGSGSTFPGRSQPGRGSAVLAVSGTVLLAELGDKTMLATITLATQQGWFGVWLGATIGMVAADALAIVVGRHLGRRLPERAVQVGAAVLFFAFGGWMLVDGLGQLSGTDPWAAAVARLDAPTAGWVALGVGLATLVLGIAGRRRVLRASPARQAIRRAASRPGSPGWWARLLFVQALLLGLAAPLLVATGLADPISVFHDPGVVVVGAGVALLGIVLLLAAQRQLTPGPATPARATRQRGPTARDAAGDPVLATRGLHTRVRNPGLAGVVLAMAGALLMVPTLQGVLATVLLVVAVQVHVRTVREPALAALHGAEFTRYTRRAGRFLPRLSTADREVPAGLNERHPERVRVG
jgi:putative Ca2+/H+ antiporter (TMEM165/GDT1 family)/protein-S-isoprenylcysteine O-methyltransferase Ste14